MLIGIGFAPLAPSAIARARIVAVSGLGCEHLANGGEAPSIDEALSSALTQRHGRAWMYYLTAMFIGYFNLVLLPLMVWIGLTLPFEPAE